MIHRYYDLNGICLSFPSMCTQILRERVFQENVQSNSGMQFSNISGIPLLTRNIQFSLFSHPLLPP